jgi:hypothetical protein
MGALVVLVLLLTWVWWTTRSVLAADRSARATPTPLEAMVMASMPARPPLRWAGPAVLPSSGAQRGLPALTEDDLIAFGLALESAEDALAELAGA